MPQISVCIPVYNVEQYIARCIESIQGQSIDDIEIIVINDCTPDHSMDIVRQYAAHDCRIKIIEHEANHGLMIARHTGYMAASGDYITFCDSDDTLPEGALEALYKKAMVENADIVSGIIKYVPVAGKRYLWSNKLSYGTDKIAVFRSLLTDEFGHNLCSRLFRRTLLQDYSYETYEKATNGEDGMLFYQVVDKASKVVTTDDVVYEYWQNMQSSSQVKFKDNALRSIAKANAMRLKIVGKYPQLQNCLDERISKSFWYFRLSNNDMRRYFSEAGLSKYCSLISLIKYQGMNNALRVLAKLVFLKLGIKY